MHQDDIDQRVLQFEEFKDKYPELRHSLYRDYVEYRNSYDEEIIENIEGMFNDITKDEQNCSEYFIGGPMFYDPTDACQSFWNYNSVQAGEIEWLTIYGNHIFVEYLLPYLLRETPYSMRTGRLENASRQHGTSLTTENGRGRCQRKVGTRLMWKVEQRKEHLTHWRIRLTLCIQPLGLNVTRQIVNIATTEHD